MTSRWRHRAPAIALALALPVVASAGAKATSTWTAPDVALATYQKVLVLAKFTDDSAKRLLEDAVVHGLKEKGIGAVQAYLVLQPADLENEASIEAKEHELGADAMLVFTLTGEHTQVKPASNAQMGVGGGVGGIFVGTGVPTGGGPTTVTTYSVKAEFLARNVAGPRWIGTYAAESKNGPQRAAQDIAPLALKQLKKSGLFPK